MTRNPQVNILAGIHMVTATRDGEPLAVKWHANGAWWVGVAGQEPQRFDAEGDAHDVFFRAAVTSPDPAVAEFNAGMAEAVRRGLLAEFGEQS